MDVFPSDYSDARARFRAAAERAGWQLEAHGLAGEGPAGETLTVEAAQSQRGRGDRVLVVTSGLHGVEGFFGSALQSAVLERFPTRAASAVRCVFVHALNPYGFAWLRRVDAGNVDPNRNFLLTGERYEGAPAVYARLDGLLNPPAPPGRWEPPFTALALFSILRHGMPAVRQAVAGGQYEFPKGLFYGGREPSPTFQLLANHLPGWVDGARSVLHLDLHTGLGRHGRCALLPVVETGSPVRPRAMHRFGRGADAGRRSDGAGYAARGTLGRWVQAQGLAPRYRYLCAEFGTYGPLRMLAGLRAENRAYHWTAPGDPARIHAGERLRELFCPRSTRWRSAVLSRGLDLVDRSLAALEGCDPGGPLLFPEDS